MSNQNSGTVNYPSQTTSPNQNTPYHGQPGVYQQHGTTLSRYDVTSSSNTWTWIIAIILIIILILLIVRSSRTQFTT
jgi:uncharacterized integral membrane protein